jgi:hypothetical protein
MHGRYARLATAVATVACAAAMAGCAASGGAVGGPSIQDTTATNAAIGSLVQVDETANNTTVRVPVGARVRLLLHSDYWTVRGSSSPDVLAQDGPTNQLPRTSRGCPPGVGCNPLETFFAARAPGTAVVSATRTTCGEAMRCTGSQGSYQVTVVVTSA